MKNHLSIMLIAGILLFFTVYQNTFGQEIDTARTTDTMYLVPAQSQIIADDTIQTGEIRMLGDNSKIRAKFRDFPNLHPLVVHFAISLILVGAVFQLLNVFLVRKDFAWIIFLLVLVGFAAGWVASRNFHPDASGLNKKAEAVLELHYMWSVWTLRTAALAIVLQMVYIIITRRKLTKTSDGTPQIVYVKNRGFALLIALILLVSACCVTLTGHYGAQLVHIEGVGPQGNFLYRE